MVPRARRIDLTPAQSSSSFETPAARAPQDEDEWVAPFTRLPC